MKFIDVFSGIGGFRSAMEKNGHECLAFCEVDKYARQSYKAIFDTEGENEYHDITKITDEQLENMRTRKFDWYMDAETAFELGVIDEIV